MEGELEDQNKTKVYEEKTLIKINDLKKNKSISNINNIYKLSFEPLEDKDNDLENILND